VAAVSDPTPEDALRAAGYLRVGGLTPEALAALHRSGAAVVLGGGDEREATADRTWAPSLLVQVVRVVLADGHTWPRAARVARSVRERPAVMAAWTAVLDAVRAQRALLPRRVPAAPPGAPSPTAGTPSTLAAVRELLAADITTAAMLRRGGGRRL
jgi:hypothetical protein